MILALIVLAITFQVATSAPTTTSPPAGFSITSFGLNGSGCPPGSASYVLSSDKSAVNVTYSQYYAEVGPTIPIDQNRKNCQLTFGISVPAGFSFGVASTSSTKHGFYFLDSGVTASQQALYYFQGSGKQATNTEPCDSVTAQNNISGPVAGATYSYTAPFNLAFSNMSPCGASSVLNIDTSIRANNDGNPKGEGFIANDSSDVSFSQWFGSSAIY
ncbi:hypothetical protein CVT26_004089 [Gymnopilus dilepis]|uniref:Ubiquitin 3 binding protein But2 C-terminal domain-containing protein n=1 Tax=Gymnopilus dilepis TaxID=231916 RepID=A0A409W289_9AGAR|nr:hypothetical protein CVT26_004089 [Gymnopilus dilepis]